MEPAESAPVATGFRVVWTAATTLPTLLKKKSTMAEKLRMLSDWQATVRDVAAELATLLDRVTDAEIAFDDDLKLLKAWERQEAGDEAGCYYHLHSLEFASDRALLRNWLGVESQWEAQRLVFLITVDCLRADRLSCNGHPHATTPAIDGLAATGVNFRRAYSTAGATPQSFIGILLSNNSQNVGKSRGLPPHLTTLAEALAGGGFHTAGHSAANVLIPPFYGYDRGFDEFHDFLEAVDVAPADESFVARAARPGAGVAQHDVEAVTCDLKANPDIRAMLMQMKQLDAGALAAHIAGQKRFDANAAALVKGLISALYRNRVERDQFHWMHLMDVHDPINVSFSRLGRFSPVQQFLLNTYATSPELLANLGGLAAKYRQFYGCAVNYVDLNLQVLVNMLVDSGLIERSLICVTADHGQALMEESVLGQSHDRNDETVAHVPLVFAGGLARRIDPSACDRPVYGLDIAPTILDVCDIAPPESFLGSSLNSTGTPPMSGKTFEREADCGRAAPAEECSPTAQTEALAPPTHTIQEMDDAHAGREQSA